MAEQLHIDAIFRQAQEQRAAEPPAAAWDKIRESLDVEETWKRISATLDAQAAAKRRRKMVLAFSLLFVLGSALVFSLLKNDTHNSGLSLHMQQRELPLRNAPRENSATANPTNHTSKTSTNRPQTLAGSPNTKDQPQQRNKDFDFSKPIVLSVRPGIGDKPKTVPGNDSAGNQKAATTVAAGRQQEDQTTVADLLAHPVAYLTPGNMADSIQQMLPRDSFYYRPVFRPSLGVFVFAGSRGSWFFNAGHDGLPGSHNSSSSKLVVSAVGGAGLSWQLRERLSLNASFYALSGGGLNFTDHSAGRAAAEELRLHYSSLNLAAAIRLGKWQAPKRFMTYGSAIGGIGFSYLRSYNEKAAATRTLLAANSYKNYDAGISLAYAQHFCFGKKLALIPSVVWHQGLVNITRRPDNLPLSFSRAYNAGLEGQVAVMYSF